MRRLRNAVFLTGALSGAFLVFPNVVHSAVLWDTLTPDSTIGFSSQLDIPTETADDFTVTGSGFKVTDVSFLGLFTSTNPTIDDIDLAFYQVFPGASDPTRIPVTVRTNGPEDTEFVAFSVGEGSLTFTTTDLGAFTIDQAILPGSGANTPGLGSGVVGGPVTGTLLQIDAKLSTPLELPPEAVFLVTAVDPAEGDFFRVAGSHPPNFPDPLPTGVADRQTWFRTNSPFPNALDPDWVRVSDVVNQQDGTANPAFNSAFRVIGEPNQVPEPGTLSLLSLGLLPSLILLRRKIPAQ
jgi:hypothetical protein